MPTITAVNYAWYNSGNIEPRQYTCGHCGNVVGPNQGYLAKHRGSDTNARIYICSFCTKPTFFEGDDQFPGAAFGSKVSHLDEDIDSLFTEARNALGVNAFTSAVLACRKILMHVSVDLGAKPGQSFLNYVGYLQKNGYIPPGSRVWVDHIREKGNEANHEIRVSSRDEAELLLSFVEMLLRITYEFPKKVPDTIAEDVEGGT